MKLIIYALRLVYISILCMSASTIQVIGFSIAIEFNLDEIPNILYFISFMANLIVLDVFFFNYDKKDSITIKTFSKYHKRRFNDDSEEHF